MKTNSALINAADQVVKSFSTASPFGKFERFTAGICMAIPFLLMTSTQAENQTKIPMLIISLGIVFLPLLIPAITFMTRDARNYGIVITTIGAVVLLGLYFLFTDFFEVEDLGSISAYVTTESAEVFGMLLSIAAMLFLTNAAVYWKRENFEEGDWRAALNAVLGILLLLVVLFPCDTWTTTQNVVATLFFIGCALAAIIRPARKEKREIHWLADFTPVIVMAIAMIGNFYGHVLNFFPFNQFNLFGAESIALWITGIDFILLSLKKEVDPVTDERSRKRRSMEQPAHQNLPPGPATA